ncbi:hypothetical protein NKJ40_00845 [Mesorhizobium sp. M0119]|uniref:hypothetical protein n=1 Tax=unclassified Mesorhizobium TaxID=325217 RepID=UPI00333DEEC7
MDNYPVWGLLLAFNGATIFLLRSVFTSIDYKSILLEKNITDDNGVAPVESYSRVAGMLGASLMVTLFWGASNVVLYFAIVRPEQVSGIVTSVGNFLFYGASLFLPYAANQLKAMFQKPA